jgi:hypothetical protein
MQHGTQCAHAGLCLHCVPTLSQPAQCCSFFPALCFLGLVIWIQAGLWLQAPPHFPHACFQRTLLSPWLQEELSPVSPNSLAVNRDPSWEGNRSLEHWWALEQLWSSFSRGHRSLACHHVVWKGGMCSPVSQNCSQNWWPGCKG